VLLLIKQNVGHIPILIHLLNLNRQGQLEGFRCISGKRIKIDIKIKISSTGIKKFI
jgi:hypothetical protein